MIGKPIGEDVRQRVQVFFRNRCAYCHSPLVIFPAARQIDHIVPRNDGGSDDEFNLCLCCAHCNRHKAARTSVIDPLTLCSTPLFHPRQDHWADHFVWAYGGAKVIGITACGRATVDTLKMNNLDLVEARQLWINAEWHPPGDDPIQN